MRECGCWRIIISMPAVVPEYTALRRDLRDSVSHALACDERLRAVIARRPSQASGTFHGKVDFSQPPWHAAAANAHLEFHALARHAERDMRMALGQRYRVRGGSDLNTAKALESACRLAENADDRQVMTLTGQLESWSSRAMVALGEKEQPKRLPRSPGMPEPACPGCGNHTLRISPLEERVFCIRKCTDEDGRRLCARMEYSAVARDWVMVWQDGTAGVAA